MMTHLKIYLISLAAFLAIDAVWLGIAARGFYRDQLEFLLTDQPNWWAALVFYLLFVAGMHVFVIVPGVRAASLSRVVRLGAFFGLVTYATYDLTNLATVKDWPLLVTVVDLGWGAVLAASVACVGYAAGRRLGMAG